MDSKREPFRVKQHHLVAEVKVAMGNIFNRTLPPGGALQVSNLLKMSQCISGEGTDWQVWI